MFTLQASLRTHLFLLLLYSLGCEALPNGVHRDRQSGTEFPSLDCTFVSGICSWRHSSLENELKWSTSKLERDHTTGNGFYLRLNNDREATTLIGRLRSPPVIAVVQTCLTFWYFMKDRDVGELSVYKIGPRYEKQRLFRIFGTQGNRWYRALVPTGRGRFQLEIMGTIVNRWPKGGIGIDDISFSYERCPQNELESTKDQPSIECDFEEDLCSWYDNEYTDRVEWVRLSSATQLKDRQPLPPYSDGKSMAGLVRREDRYNVEGQLQGPTISVDSYKACFSFWYKIQGSMVEQLEVRLIDHDDWSYETNKDPITLYSSGEQARPTWIQANITLPNRENFFIIFSAMAQRSRLGMVFIDDITISHGGPCPKENQEQLINCDFDKDLCRWYRTTEKDQNDWVRHMGPTATNFTGPSHDHTTGDGYYMLFDASKVENAYLYSQDISVDSNGACFSFWYHMYGADVYTLELSVDQESGATQTPWSLEGGQENKWLQQNVTLSPFYTERGRLIFSAQSLYFPRGDIALDDFSITFGAPCESDIPEPTVPDDYEEITDTEELVTKTSIPISSTTEISELPTPQLILKDGLTTVYENSRVELECQSNTNHTVGMTWYKQEEDKAKLKPIHENRENILYDEIQLKDGGTFACTTSFEPDVTSDLSNFVAIKVVKDDRRKPFLHANADILSALEVDKTVSLICGFDDVKGAVYHWKTNSPAFVDSTLPNDRFLILNGTNLEHSGIYSCRISKDGFMTAKSRELKIRVEPGKHCDYNWDCRGDAYKRNCVRNRCKCSKNAAPVGRICLFKPLQPKILTFPRFLEYGVGESFYVICRAKTPVPPMLGYTFITPKGQFQSRRVLKISNATKGDSGYYQCFVTHRNGTSERSNDIVIQIKEFTDLSCDFQKDLCKWFQRNDSGLSNFERITSADKGPGAYIQVPKGESDMPNEAILLSPTVDRTTLNCCLSFEYQMLGSDVRGLSVMTYTFAERLHGDGGTRLWTVFGEKGKRWMTRKVTVPPGDDFYIAFEAIGPAAITNIEFIYRGGC